MAHKILTRRMMIQGVTLTGLAVCVVACGDGLENFAQLKGVGIQPEEGQISANHGHVAVISDKQLKEGKAIVLDIRGGSNHPHQVSLTAEQVVAVRDGKKVVVNSSATNHAHVVTFNPEAVA